MVIVKDEKNYTYPFWLFQEFWALTKLLTLLLYLELLKLQLVSKFCILCKSIKKIMIFYLTTAAT